MSESEFIGEDSFDGIVLPRLKFNDDRPDGHGGDEEPSNNLKLPALEPTRYPEILSRGPTPVTTDFFKKGDIGRLQFPQTSCSHGYPTVYGSSSFMVENMGNKKKIIDGFGEGEDGGGGVNRKTGMGLVTGQSVAQGYYRFQSSGYETLNTRQQFTNKQGFLTQQAGYYVNTPINQQRDEDNADDEDEEDEEDITDRKQMQMHQAFVKKKQKTWKLDDATGVYYIKCDETANNWPQFVGGDGFTMTIMEDQENPHRLMAEFDIGVVAGLMRFTLPGQQPIPDNDSEDEDEDEDAHEDDDEDEDEEAEEVEIDGLLFPARSIVGKSPTGNRKRDAIGAGTQGPQSKKPCTGTSEPATTGLCPLKLLFTWRGRESGEGEIEVDTGSNRGTIQFSDENLISFVGKMDISIVGRNVEIEGFKIGNVPRGKQPAARWSELSSWAHRREEVRRFR